jgi:hypothetical protein
MSGVGAALRALPRKSKAAIIIAAAWGAVALHFMAMPLIALVLLLAIGVFVFVSLPVPKKATLQEDDLEN